MWTIKLQPIIQAYGGIRCKPFIICYNITILFIYTYKETVVLVLFVIRYFEPICFRTPSNAAVLPTDLKLNAIVWRCLVMNDFVECKGMCPLRPRHPLTIPRKTKNLPHVQGLTVRTKYVNVKGCSAVG